MRLSATLALLFTLTTTTALGQYSITPRYFNQATSDLLNDTIWVTLYGIPEYDTTVIAHLSRNASVLKNPYRIVPHGQWSQLPQGRDFLCLRRMNAYSGSNSYHGVGIVVARGQKARHKSILAFQSFLCASNIEHRFSPYWRLPTQIQLLDAQLHLHRIHASLKTWGTWRAFTDTVNAYLNPGNVPVARYSTDTLYAPILDLNIRNVPDSAELYSHWKGPVRYITLDDLRTLAHNRAPGYYVWPNYGFNSNGNGLYVAELSTGRPLVVLPLPFSGGWLEQLQQYSNGTMPRVSKPKPNT